MRVAQRQFEEFFMHRLPDEGFTLEEVYREYFGLIDGTRSDNDELHGHAVTMDGNVVLPELRP